MKRWQRTFIESLAQTGNVSAASRAVGRPRAFVYQARQRYPEFAAAWAQAMEEASDRLEMEALRRAVDGVPEDKFYRGAIVGQIVRYSDGLLMFLLKARRPDLFDSHAAGCRQGEDGDDSAASDARNVTELRRRMASMRLQSPAMNRHARLCWRMMCLVTSWQARSIPITHAFSSTGQPFILPGMSKPKTRNGGRS